MKIPLLEHVVIRCLGTMEVIGRVVGITSGESLTRTGLTYGTSMSLGLGVDKASGNVVKGITSSIGET